MDLKSLVTFIVIGVSSVTLQGCSSTTQAYYDSFILAFSASDAEVTLEKVMTSPVDLLSVKHGDRKIAVMALAYIEDDGYKWVSSDHAVLVIDHGVIVRTAGLPIDLLYTTNTNANPLSSVTQLSSQWQRTVDIEGELSGVNISSQWREDGVEPLNVFGLEINTTRVIETVTMTPNVPFITLNQTWENKYLVDKASGQVIYAEQRFAPDTDPFTLTFLSRASRLLNFSVVEG